MLQTALEWLQGNWELSALLAMGLELVLRKVPKLRSGLKLLDAALDKVPGLKSVDK